MNYVNRTEAIHKLESELFLSGGATVSLEGELVTRGFAVSTRPDLEYTFPIGHPNYNHVLIYNWVCALPPLPAYHMLGIWHDKESETVYLDVSVVIGIREYALKQAKINKQQAIYDLENKETIWLMKQYQ